MAGLQAAAAVLLSAVLIFAAVFGAYAQAETNATNTTTTSPSLSGTTNVTTDVTTTTANINSTTDTSPTTGVTTTESPNAQTENATVVEYAVDDFPCARLYPSQICCVTPDVDPDTQSFVNCQPNNKATSLCFARQGVICDGKVHQEASVVDSDVVLCDGRPYASSSAIETRLLPCNFVDRDDIYDYNTALALSVFLGMFGADRFYLGYYGLGVAKLCTFGFFGVGQLIDIVLIATETVGPADGTSMRMPFYGPRLVRKHLTDETLFANELDLHHSDL